MPHQIVFPNVRKQFFASMSIVVFLFFIILFILFTSHLFSPLSALLEAINELTSLHASFFEAFVYGVGGYLLVTTSYLYFHYLTLQSVRLDIYSDKLIIHSLLRKVFISYEEIPFHRIQQVYTDDSGLFVKLFYSKTLVIQLPEKIIRFDYLDDAIPWSISLQQRITYFKTRLAQNPQFQQTYLEHQATKSSFFSTFFKK